MTNIHVIFPVNGGVVMTHENQAIIEGQHLNWHFRSDNLDVKQVRIEFQQSSAKFFNNENHVYTKPLNYKGGNRAHQHIWGQAPVIPTSTKSDKYTVFGLDAKGGTVVDLDPRILTQKP